MTITLTGKNLRIEDVVKVARHGEQVKLDAGALERIDTCRALLERKVAAGETMYGINTGIGELAGVRLSDDETANFQKYLIYNHSAGIGDPMPLEHVRGAMLGRINMHSLGHSGCRRQISQTYEAMLNAGVTPVVCKKGSVGACGDLAPMSQIALSLMGEGESFYKGERMATSDAMAKAGIPVPGLEVRDGLSAINGSNVIAAISALTLYDAERWIKQAEIAAAMTLEALQANMKPYEAALHELRGFQGAQTTAANLRQLMAGSDLVTGKVEVKVQDAYSMRSTPQIIGSLRDFMAYTRKQVEIELNGAADNPVFLPEEDLVLTGANFQATPISMPLDMIGAGITMVSLEVASPPSGPRTPPRHSSSSRRDAPAPSSSRSAGETPCAGPTSRWSCARPRRRPGSPRLGPRLTTGPQRSPPTSTRSARPSAP